MRHPTSLLVCAILAMVSPAMANILTNGDFSAGNTGFSSGMNFNTDLTVEGNYTIGDNPANFASGAASFGDHTTGSGNQLIANGTTNGDVAVWSQTVAVTPNTEYEFAEWAASWSSVGPAVLQLRVDGVDVGTPLTLPTTAGQWVRGSAIWTSGSATSATFALVNTNLAGFGNDFALDDLTLLPTDNNRPPVVPVPAAVWVGMPGLVLAVLGGRRLRMD